MDKGSLGDTFPDSFCCFDLRAQHIKSAGKLDGAIQSLGRLCNHRKDITCIADLPYVLLNDSAKKQGTLFTRLQSCGMVDYMKLPISR